MAKKTKTGGFSVMVAIQGQAPKVYNVGSGATVRSAIVAAGLEPEKMGGAITVNGEPAELAQRLRQDDLLAVTPKVAGGSR